MVFASAVYLLGCSPALIAQQQPLGDDVSRPMPGTGHDYIHALSETVSPANGTVNLKLDLPVPRGRGLTLPFAVTYNSGEVFHFTEGYPGCGSLDSSQCSDQVLSDRTLGGWGDTIPYATFSGSQVSLPPPHFQGGAGSSCTLSTSYNFYDPTGVSHVLGIAAISPASDGSEACLNAPYSSNRTFYTESGGGDSQVQSSSNNCNGDTSTRSTDCYSGDPAFHVTDVAGTVYHFAAGGGGVKGTAFVFPYIEDRNGNVIQVNENCANCSSPLTVTDTLGRQLINISYKLDSNVYEPASYTVGGLSYTPAYTTTSANWAAGSHQVNPPTDPPISCIGNFSVKEGGGGVQSLTLPNGKQYTFQYDPTWGLLSEVDYPDGGWVKYTWKLSDTYSTLASFDGEYPSNYTPSLAVGACNFQYQTPVVATRQVGYAPGSSAALSQSFTYVTQWDQQDPFIWDTKTTTVVTTDNVMQQTTKTVYQYSPIYQAGQPNAGYTPQLPVESKITYFDGSGKLLQTVNKQWQDQFLMTQQQTVLPNGIKTETDKNFSYFPGVPLEEDDYTAGTAPTLARKTTYNYYEFGFPNQVITQDGAGNKVAETDVYYDGQTSLGAASTAVPVAGVSGLTTHDETNYGPGSTLPRGNATKVVQWENNGTSPTTSYTYDETGQTLSMHDPNGNTTSYSYADNYAGGGSAGNTNTYLTQITGPAVNVAHIEKFSYRFKDGQLASATDENGQVTSYAYNDPLSRMTETDYPDGGKIAMSYNDAAPNPSVTTTQLINSSGTQKVTTAIRDGMGHVVHTKLTSDPAGADTVDMVYDGQGDMVSATNPYRSTSDPTYGLTRYTYDALERRVGETEPDGSTLSWCYNSIPSAPTGGGAPKQSCSSGDLSSKTGIWVDATNENGISRQQVSDGLGRLVAVLEPNPVSGADTLETDYKYDVLDNLTQVDQWGGAVNSSGDRQRAFVYDSLSRLSSSINPEAGTIGYTYDSNGNVHTRTDARGVVTTYSYDGLNRLGGKSYTNDPSGTPAATYAYDTPAPGWNFLDQTAPAWTGVKQTNLVGRLSYEGNGSSATVYGYDLLGRTTLKSVCTPSTCGTDHYDMHASYDLAGGVKFADRGLDAARNAASPGAGYYYGGLQVDSDGAGHMKDAVADIVDATHPAFIVSGLQYSPLGGMTAATFGGVYGETDQYTPRGWLSSRTGAIGATGYARTGTLVHDPAGNVIQQSDTFTNSTATYVPDKLNRLTSFSNAFGAATYGYDAWGNMTSRTNTAGLGYTYSLTMTPQNRVSQAGSTDSAFAYDASGNVLSDGLNIYSYDGEGRLHAVNGAPNYVYGPEGERVATVQSGAVSAEYLYGTDGTLTTELAPGGKLMRGLLYGGGMHLADYTQDGKTVFHLSDEVGSLVNTIDQTGAAIETCAASPFGESLNCSPSVDYTENHFTDKKRDQESGLDYFGARFYSSTESRFTSPDWSEVPDSIPYADMDNPQSFNLYSYVRNNPLSNADPDGHDCVVQSRVDDNHETVSTSAGNCDGVKLGSGQSATYVPGTVTGISANGGNSIDIGYNSYDGQSSGVTNSRGAPAFDNPGIDGPANAAIFGQIGNGGMAAIKAFTVGSVIGGVTAGVGLSALGTGAGLTTLAGEDGVGLATNQAINRMIGASQRELLKDFFMSGKLPEGLSKRTLQLYKEVAQRAIAAGKDQLGVQAQRLQMINNAIR